MGNDSATEIVLDESGEVQGEEVVVSKRGAMGCGILAAETHAHLEKCWGLFSCNVESVGGLGYCNCCSHPRGVAFNESTTEIVLGTPLRALTPAGQEPSRKRIRDEQENE